MSLSKVFNEAINHFRILFEIGWIGDDTRYRNAAIASEEIYAKHPKLGSMKVIMGAMEFAKWKDESFQMPSTPVMLKKFAVAIGTTVLGILSMILLIQELFTHPGNILGLFILLILGPACLWTGQSTFRRLITAFQIKSIQQAEQPNDIPQVEVPEE